MKELILGFGGRRLHNEDLDAIQKSIESAYQAFASEQPFIISGMVFNNTSGSLYDISEGYLWLGSKIRKFSATTGVDLSSPTYVNATE